MQRIANLILLASIVICLPSCEGCVRKVSKKATEVAISAAEGVSEAINEHGERVSEKAANALGAIAKGAGKGVDKLLDEHADDVAETAGRTLVQSFDGFTEGIAEEYYDKIDDVSAIAADGIVASVELLGKIPGKPVVDTYFIIENTGSFGINFVFKNIVGDKIMEKTAEAVTDGMNRYTVVSFALTDSEIATWANVARVDITIDRASNADDESTMVTI